MPSVLYDSATVHNAIYQVAARLNMHYTVFPPEKPLVVLCVLKGGVRFFAELVKQLDFVEQVHGYVAVKSFIEDSKQTRLEEPEIVYLDMPSVEGRDVLIVDDILDSGATLSLLQRTLSSLGAKNVNSVFLLNNDKRDDKLAQATWTCLNTGGHFVYGFGLDREQGLGREANSISY